MEIISIYHDVVRPLRDQYIEHFKLSESVCLTKLNTCLVVFNLDVIRVESRGLQYEALNQALLEEANN